MSWSNPTPTPTMMTSMDCGCRFRFRRFWRTRLQFRSLLFGLLTFTLVVWEWDAPVVVLLLRSNANVNSNSNFNRVQSLVVAFSPWPETLSRSRSRWTTKTLTKRNTNAAVALLNHSLLPRILTGSSGESARAFPTALCSQSSNNNENSDNENDNDENNDNDEFFRRRNQHWVVLVDDEESIRYAVGDFLYDRGYEVTACADANSLLDLIALRNNNNNNDKNPSSNTDNSNDDPQPRLPDVIISDVRMPESEKNGYELVEFLRSGAALSSSSSSSLPSSSSSSSLPLPPPLATERSKRYGASLRTVPIVLLTAKAMTDDRIKGYRAGADVVVPKPFSPEELVSILDNLIRLRQQRLRPDALLVSSSSSSSSSTSSSSSSSPSPSPSSPFSSSSAPSTSGGGSSSSPPPPPLLSSVSIGVAVSGGVSPSSNAIFLC
mmetsp:Transcript_2672/g.7123  ORF Transcript_2672/g.7123 Transcript_2672/m.7123 type:complete len:435 (-) Transcript_2672:355-1659(-)